MGPNQLFSLVIFLFNHSSGLESLNPNNLHLDSNLNRNNLHLNLNEIRPFLNCMCSELTLNLNTTPVPRLRPEPTPLFSSSSPSSPRTNSHVLVPQLDSSLHPYSTHSLCWFLNSIKSSPWAHEYFFHQNSHNIMYSQIRPNPPLTQTLIILCIHK